MNNVKAFFRRLWSYSVVRHLVSGSIAVLVATSGQKAGLDQQSAQQLGNAAGEIVRTLPAEQ